MQSTCHYNVTTNDGSCAALASRKIATSPHVHLYMAFGESKRYPPGVCRNEISTCRVSVSNLRSGSSELVSEKYMSLQMMAVARHLEAGESKLRLWVRHTIRHSAAIVSRLRNEKHRKAPPLPLLCAFRRRRAWRRCVACREWFRPRSRPPVWCFHRQRPLVVDYGAGCWAAELSFAVFCALASRFKF